MADQRTRETPRISVNVLTDYLTASPARRRRLLQEQKKPRGFQVTYYREAEEAIANALAGDRFALATAIRNLQSNPGEKEWEIVRRATGVEAIRSFQNLQQLDLTGYSTKLGPARPRHLAAGPLAISVRPEVLLERETDQGGVLGAIKLFFSKNEPLGEGRARYAGVILQRYLEGMRGTGEPDYRSCLTIDVFAQSVFTAPRTYRRRWQDVEAACHEIAQVWPTI